MALDVFGDLVQHHGHPVSGHHERQLDERVAGDEGGIPEPLVGGRGYLAKQLLVLGGNGVVSSDPASHIETEHLVEDHLHAPTVGGHQAGAQVAQLFGVALLHLGELVGKGVSPGSNVGDRQLPGRGLPLQVAQGITDRAKPLLQRRHEPVALNAQALLHGVRRAAHGHSHVAGEEASIRHPDLDRASEQAPTQPEPQLDDAQGEGIACRRGHGPLLVVHGDIALRTSDHTRQGVPQLLQRCLPVLPLGGQLLAAELVEAAVQVEQAVGLDAGA